MRLIDALAGDGTHGTTRTLHSRSPVGPVHHDRALCAVRHQSEDGLQVAGPIRRAGATALGDRSRAPHRCPHKIADEVAHADLRRPGGSTRAGGRRSSWTGSARGTRRSIWPAVSTAGDLLARQGLVKKRRRRRPYAASRRRADQRPRARMISGPRTSKASFAPRDGVYCYPLTVADQHTRYLLACHGLLSTKGTRRAPGLRPALPRVRPAATRFAPTMACRSRRPGFTASRSSTSGGCGSAFSTSASRPASPQENGAHERMHKTLKAEAIRPPRATLAPQQRAFNRFRAEYNDERPHQFLDGRHARRRAIGRRPARTPARCRPSSIPDTSS